MVNGAVLSPPTERLAAEVKDDSEQTEEQHERTVGHDGRNVAVLGDPVVDKHRESVTPDVLVDGDGDEQAAGDGLVTVDGVGRDHGGQSGDLDAGARVADDDDDGPVPVVLVADRHDDVAEVHDQDVWDHSEETHFRLADTLVLERLALGDPVTEGTGGDETDEGADENGKVHEADLQWCDVVWWGGEGLGLGQVEGQEGTAGPGDDEGGPDDDGEGEELPWKPEVEHDRFERGWV